MPEADAEALVQDAMLAFLTTTVPIDDPKAWLVGAICNACRSYWRSSARTWRVEGGSLADAAPLVDEAAVERIERVLLLRRIVSLLSEHDKELLRLHYFEQLTAREIASVFSTTVGYVEKMISVALRRARKAYAALQPASPVLETREHAFALSKKE